MSPARTIGSFLGKRLGLIPQERWVTALERAEPELVRRRGRGLADLAPDLETDPELCLELAGLLSVGETYFLRHGPQFDVLVRHVARRLATLGDSERIRIWSAGCSSGEEPYSIAIAIHTQLGAEALERVDIVATDVDVRAIAKARRAEYTAWSFRGAPSWLLPTFFEDAPGARRRLVHPAVLRAVEFQAMPLATRAPLFAAGTLDLVFFRNVAIYLLDEARVELQLGMRRALRASGLLLQGPSDPPPPMDDFEMVAEDSTRCCFRAREPGVASADGRTRARTASVPPLRGAPGPAIATPRPVRTRPADAVPERALVGAAAPVAAPAPSVAAPAPSVVTPAPSVVTSAAEIECAMTLAERGDVEAALASLGPVRAESSPRARCVRGKIFLAAQRFAEAVDELRAAVFLEPEAIEPRYWYASALHAARSERAAHAQLRELERRLATWSGGVPIDGDLPVGELLGSVRLLLEAYR